jgi:cysteinyl-tRNA synthetase
MKLFNSLTRKLETLQPIQQGKVGVYTCGPTVYDYVSIGNWRTYFLGDILVRTLKSLDYKVDYVMNITDVGHLTGDNLGDADSGEDRLEKAARKEKKTAWDVAKFYSDDFIQGLEKLNMVKPKIVKATDHIKEQIEMVAKIEEAGMTYKITDGIYFDVGKFEKSGNAYGKLSTLDKIKAGARVEVNKEKRDPRDFALWKFNNTGKKRDMEWDSPWGSGFPGWHIECSAMSCKYLGDQFDIHVGGEDLRSTHHPNEIAQAEVATGKNPFVKYWIHGAFLTVDGGRMGKSLGNAYNLQDIVAKGFTADELRYFYLGGHYRKGLNFTWEGLKSAQSGLRKLRREFLGWGDAKIGCAEYEQQFLEALENDLNLPQAMAVVWAVVKSTYPGSAKKATIIKFDKVLSLGLADLRNEKEEMSISNEMKELIKKRKELRSTKQFAKADKVRLKLEALGYEVSDDKL